MPSLTIEELMSLLKKNPELSIVDIKLELGTEAEPYIKYSDSLEDQLRRRHNQFTELLVGLEGYKEDVCETLFGEEFIDNLAPGEIFADQLIQKAYERINNGTMDMDNYLEMYVQNLAFQGKTIYSTIGMIIYSLAEMRVLAESEERDKSWRLLSDISYHLGSLEMLKCHDRRTNNSSRASKKGGDEKARRLSESVRNELIRLIHEKKPKRGWKSAVEVGDSLHQDLQEYMEENESELKSENAYDDILRWIRNNSEVKYAFEQTKRVE